MTVLRAWLIAACAALSLAIVPVASADPADAGKVNFVKAAQSDFDHYVVNPTQATKEFMNRKYARVRAYAPFFDSRTDWFPGAWAYENAYAIYPGQEGSQAQYILKDAQGRRLYIPYNCGGGACSQYAADIGSPGWRRHYIDRAKARIARGYKGIFVDDVNLAFKVSDGTGHHVAPIDPRTGQTMTHTNWQRYFAEFMEQLRDELPAGAEIVHNQVYFDVGLSSPYVRRAIDAATHIEVERGVNDTGITSGNGTFGFETVMAWVDYAHSRGKNVVYDVQASWGREYALATYFLTSNGKDGLGMDVGGLPDNWWSGYDAELGAPQGPRYESGGVYRRDFEHGTVLVNQPGRPTRTISVGAGFKTIDGTPRSSVSVAGRDGVVLLRDAPDPDPDPTPDPDPDPTPQPDPDPTPEPQPTPAPAPQPRPDRGGPRVAPDTAAPKTTRPRSGRLVLRGRIARSKRARASRRLTVSVVLRTADGRRLVRRVNVTIGRTGRFRAVLASVPHGTYRVAARALGLRSPLKLARGGRFLVA